MVSYWAFFHAALIVLLVTVRADWHLERSESKCFCFIFESNFEKLREVIKTILTLSKLKYLCAMQKLLIIITNITTIFSRTIEQFLIIWNSLGIIE